MADEPKKITELPTKTSTALTDYLVVVGNTAGTPVTSKITVTNFFTNSSANIHIVANTTPESSTIYVKQGTLLCDANYLYVAVSDNLLKRITLVSF